MEMLPF